MSAEPIAWADPLSVVLVDDHRTFSDLLTMAIDTQPDMVCVGSAHTVSAALAEVERCLPDLVIMDVQLGPEDGIDATAQIMARHPDLLVLVLTAFADVSLMDRVAEAGACALLPKDGCLDDLFAVMRSASHDSFTVHPALLKRLLAGRSRAEGAVPALSPREREVLDLLAVGDSVHSIARALGISVHTTRGHVKAILAKLGAHSQLEAVTSAQRLGLVRLTPSR